MENSHRSYIEIHLAVFLFGFAAIFGELISLSAAVLIFWRTCITFLSFLFFREIYTDLKKMKLSDAFIFIGIGVIVCVHWLCFYGSIKLANASIALVAFSSMSIFTSFIEPLFLRTRLQSVDILFGLAIIPAMALTVHSLDFSMYTGAFVGILSALLAALFSVLNKKYISRTGPVTITFLNVVGVLMSISVIVPILIRNMEINFFPKDYDWLYIIFLALICTTLGFVLMTRSFRYLSAFSANFVLNLEPVYGVILAMVVLKEHKELNLQFYLGVILITSLVFLYPVVKKRKCIKK